MIKFQKFYVTNGSVKARVSYSEGPINDRQADGSFKLRECITLYARDYTATLAAVFEGTDTKYQNDTDSMTDYFDEGRVRIFPESPLYAACKARCDAEKAAREAKARAKRPASVENLLVRSAFKASERRFSGESLSGFGALA